MDPSFSSPSYNFRKTKTNRRISLSAKKPSLKSVNQAIFKTPYHIVESFGSSLPVHVRESLTFLDKNVAVSVRLSSDGWAWFVCGRKLLIWQCKQIIIDGTKRTVSHGCRELTLPSSDLAYRAELVVVYNGSSNHMPSCIAVSPEGILRYWHNISSHNAYLEINAELKGQECDSLTDISPIGCILATTTATIVLIQAQTVNNLDNVVCRTLKMPQGWLGGITRRMSSLIFGSIQSSQVMETKLIKVVAVSDCNHGYLLYVLAGHTLQKWLIVSGELERLIYELDVNQLAVDAFQKTIWEPCGGNHAEVQVWLLDMQPCDGGVTLLMGAVNNQISPQFYYAFGVLLTDSFIQPARFDRFCPLKKTGFYRENEESELLSCKFLLSGASAFIYSRRSVVAVSVVNYNDEADLIDFLGNHDEILGGGMCINTPVFFSVEHGTVSIKSSETSTLDDFTNNVSDMATIDPSSNSMLSEHMNLVVPDNELAEMTINKDSVTQLKAAFLHYVKRNMDTAENIVCSLFQLDEEPPMVVDNPLDTIVTKVSLDIMNDIPTVDPRWVSVKAKESSMGCSTSLNIVSQLEDKLRTLDWYLAFLKEFKIWQKLSAITVRGSCISTIHHLYEHGEKLTAAIALKNMQANYSTLVNQCISHVVGKKRLPKGLSQVDVFYREVSRVVECLQVLTQWSETLALSDRRPQEIVPGLADANHVLTTALQDVLQYRKQKMQQQQPTVNLNFEYLPWTAAPGGEGLHDSLLLQHSLTFKHGVHVTGDVDMKNKLLDQMVTLTDVILDGRRSYVDSLRKTPKFDSANQQYETNRRAIISTFLEEKEYERAAVLAEKYLDFHILIQICEVTNNSDRLDSYCDKFEKQEFSQYLFNWYLKEQKPGHMLNKYRNQTKSKKRKQELTSFLGDHPSLSWINDIYSQDYESASDTLHNLASNEVEFLQRKKTMLSLAKLTMLASGDDDSMEDKVNVIDTELELISHQEDLPKSVVSAYGLDIDKPQVMRPSEIIKLFISEENQTVTEFDYKKALDLLDYIEDELERNELRHSIWCSAILRDDWTNLDPNSSSDCFLNLLFFKLVELVEYMDASYDFLPPINSIIEAKELGPLKDENHFQYVLKLGYEYFQKKTKTAE